MMVGARSARSLHRAMFVATMLIVLYGLSLPSLVLWRLLPEARAIETESAATSRAFASLRGQSAIIQNAAALSRVLREPLRSPRLSDIDSLANIVQQLRDAPRAEYSEIAEEMRGAFASSIQLTDRFTASLDEAVRAARLGEDSVFTKRIELALTRVPEITRALDETQRTGLADLLARQQRMREAGYELIYWTIGWLATGVLLVWYLVVVTRQRLLKPLDELELGLTQLSNGDLDVRIHDTGDELGRLANVFNRAIDVLRRRAEEQGRFAAAGQLLADVAHEVNNPLMAILGTTETRLADESLDDATRVDMELVRDQARRAGKLLSGLLRFMRAAEEPEEVIAMSVVVNRAMDLMAYQFPLHRIECRTEFVDGAPPVRTAATRLEQVMVNLLTNAVHAMLETPGKRELFVRVWHINAITCVTVRDTGAGVAAEMRARLFQPFASTKGDRGTGLGLYICRRIARENGGDLTYVDAMPGAEFVLCLPSCVTPQTATAVAASVVAATPGALAGLNVLLVDDEAGVRTAIARFLRRGGANVREAAHGLEALNLIDNEQPDVVLLDLRMPVMDGYALISKMRESHPALVERVLVLSGDLAAGNTEKAPVPPNRMLAKPVALKELAQRLQEVATS
jgi:signal transduction histidine kinase